MDLTLTELGTLAVLALVDSTSVGTLIVPIWLLTAPHGVRASRLALYLTTVVAFYFAVGVLLLAGIDVVSGLVSGLEDLEWLRWVQLVVGASMLIWAVTARTGRSDGEPGRLRRWRDRVTTDGSARGLVGLALVVTVVELAMMLPYLAAIGTVAASDTTWPVAVLVLAGYCALMVLPTVVLATARAGLRSRIDPALRRLDGWMTRNAAETTAWVVGLLGFYLAGNAYQVLF